MKRYLAVILILLTTLSACAKITHEGKVIRVADGDTITILTNTEKVKIRLAEIDTPERAQPYGKQAKDALAKLIAGKSVIVEEQTVDGYERVVGRVYLHNLDVNAEMVKQGHAWVYREYSYDFTLYKLEIEAEKAKRGLWALHKDERVPPWEWRKSKRNN